MGFFDRATPASAGLIPGAAIDRLNWLANIAFHRDMYFDGRVRAITDYFAPAYAAVGLPPVDSPEIREFHQQYLSELLEAARTGPPLTAAGAYMVAMESPECSFGPATGQLRGGLYDLAAEHIVPQFHSITWPASPCAVYQSFKLAIEDGSIDSQ